MTRAADVDHRRPQRPDRPHLRRHRRQQRPRRGDHPPPRRTRRSGDHGGPRHREGRSRAEPAAVDHPKADLEIRHLDLLDLDTVHAFADGLRADAVTVTRSSTTAASAPCPATQPARRGEPAGHQPPRPLRPHRPAARPAGRGPRPGRGDRRRPASIGSAASTRTTSPPNAATHPAAPTPRSKLANVLFALELDRRLRAAGSPVRSLLAPWSGPDGPARASSCGSGHAENGTGRCSGPLRAITGPLAAPRRRAGTPILTPRQMRDFRSWRTLRGMTPSTVGGDGGGPPVVSLGGSCGRA